MALIRLAVMFATMRAACGGLMRSGAAVTKQGGSCTLHVRAVWLQLGGGPFLICLSAGQFWHWGGGPLPMCLRLYPILRLGEDGGDGGAGRMSSDHPSPILHARRDNISRKGKSITPIFCA